MVSKDYDNFISSTSDPGTANGVKGFINTIQEKPVSASIAYAVAAAQKLVEDARKDYDKVAKKEGELRKSKEKIEKHCWTSKKAWLKREKH